MAERASSAGCLVPILFVAVVFAWVCLIPHLPDPCSTPALTWLTGDAYYCR